MKLREYLKGVPAEDKRLVARLYQIADGEPVGGMVQVSQETLREAASRIENLSAFVASESVKG